MALRDRPDGDEAVGLGEGQTAPEHGVDEGEDRGVETDAEGEGKGSHGGKERTAGEGPDTVGDVLPEIPHGDQTRQEGVGVGAGGVVNRPPEIENCYFFAGGAFGAGSLEGGTM